MKATKEITFNKTHNLKVEGVLVEKKVSTTKKTSKVKQPTIRELILGIGEKVDNLDKRVLNVESEISIMKNDIETLKGQ